MSVRHKPKRRCRNCPETVEGLPVKVSVPIATYQGEGESLWKVALVACGTILELFFRYIAMDVPGKPIPQLERLHGRLGELITLRKEREKLNESSSFEDGRPSREDHSSAS